MKRKYYLICTFPTVVLKTLVCVQTYVIDNSKFNQYDYLLLYFANEKCNVFDYSIFVFFFSKQDDNFFFIRFSI